MASAYHDLIHEFAPGADPALVEGWLRLAHGTLDHIHRNDLAAQVRFAAQVIADAPEPTRVLLRQLAESYGLTPAPEESR